MDARKSIHILRNPWGWTENGQREARLWAADEIERLRGQRDVLEQLLGDAGEVLHTLTEPETQDEAEMLRTLKDRIADARGAIWIENEADAKS